MNAGIYINFRTESQAAMNHYEKVFGSVQNNVMTYDQMPSNGEDPFGGSMKGKILNGNMNIHGLVIMFSDVPESMGYLQGNNITLVVNIKDEALLRKEFEALAEGGNIVMPLAETFWTSVYGQVIDKFGIGWQFSLLES